MSALSEDRRSAIERSGWGEDFHLVQPHNLTAMLMHGLPDASAAIAGDGVVTPDELEALAVTRTRLKNCVRAQPNRRTAVTRARAT